MSTSDHSDARASSVLPMRSRPEAAEASPVQMLFHVTASADPNVLPRLIGPLAKLGLTPSRVHASREDGDGSELTIDLRLASVSRREAGLVEKMVRAVVGVRQVIVVTEANAG